MANYATLKAVIAAAIKQNGNNEITGILLQQQLLAMVDSLGVGYQYAGIATPTTDPGTPDQKVFYLCGPGTYPNFNSLKVNEYNIGILYYDSSWHLSTIDALSGNLFGIGLYLTSQNVSNGYIGDNGTTIISSDHNVYCEKYFQVLPNANYLFDNSAGYTIAVYWYALDKTPISNSWFSSRTSWTAPDGAYYARFGFRQTGLTKDTFVPVAIRTDLPMADSFIVQPSNTMTDIDTDNNTIKFTNVNVKFNNAQYGIDGTYSLTADSSSSNKIMVFIKASHTIKIIDGNAFNKETQILIGGIVYAYNTVYSVDLPFACSINGKYAADVLCSPPVLLFPSNTKPVLSARNATLVFYNTYVVYNGVQYVIDGTYPLFDTNFGSGSGRVLAFSVKSHTIAIVDRYYFNSHTEFIAIGTIVYANNIIYSVSFPFEYVYDVQANEKDAISNLLQRTLFPQIFVDHFFMEGATQWAYLNNAQTIPAESLFNIEIAKRLGFKVTEASVHETSDGNHIVLHGESGKFGYQVVDLNGQATYADTLINSVTLQWIKDNLRYHSTIEKYRVAPPSLEEWLQECKKLNMIPFLAADNDDVVEKVNKIMGKDNFMSWRGSHTKISVPIQISDIGSADTTAILAACDAVGKPCIYGVATTSYTDEQLKNIVNVLHENGYLVGWSANYSNEQENQRCLRLGFDWATSGWNIPDFGIGNLCNLFGDDTFTDFTHNGTVSGGKLNLSNGQTVAPNATLQSVFLGGGQLYIRFVGTINLTMGSKINAQFSSNGEETMWFSTAFFQQSPSFLLTASGNVVITDLSYKASKL